MAPWLRHVFFQSPLQGMFLLGTLLAPSQLVLVFFVPHQGAQGNPLSEGLYAPKDLR